MQTELVLPTDDEVEMVLRKILTQHGRVHASAITATVARHFSFPSDKRDLFSRLMTRALAKCCRFVSDSDGVWTVLRI